MIEELTSYELIIEALRRLPPSVYRCLILRVGGMHPDDIAMGPKDIAAHTKLSYNSVRTYLNTAYDELGIGGLDPAPLNHHLLIFVRPIILEGQRNPSLIWPYVEANPEVNYDKIVAVTGPTWKLAQFIGTDPDDAKHLARFTVTTVAFVVVLIIIVFTLLAAAIAAFTQLPTPLLYLGI